MPAVWLASARVVLAAFLAFAASWLLGLPDAHWAVMTVLIVARPDVEDSSVAAAHRLRGTLLGSAAGIAAEFLRHHGLGDPWALLAMLAVLAPVASIWPELRAAPVAAIIVSSTGAHAADPLTVSALRVAQVVIGVAAALLVTRVAPKGIVAHDRRLLVSRIAGGLERLLAGAFGLPVPADTAEADALRRDLRRLGALARSKGRAGADAAGWLTPLAALHNDLQFVARTRKTAPTTPDDAALVAFAAALCGALGDVSKGLPLARETFDRVLEAATTARAPASGTGGYEYRVVQWFALRRICRTLASMAGRAS